jgi:hypothetical protein
MVILSRGIDITKTLCYNLSMAKKTITKAEFDKIKGLYEEAVQARADAIVTMRDSLKWTFTRIGAEFEIKRQAAEKIYRENKKRNER